MLSIDPAKKNNRLIRCSWFYLFFDNARKSHELAEPQKMLSRFNWIRFADTMRRWSYTRIQPESCAIRCVYSIMYTYVQVSIKYLTSDCMYTVCGVHFLLGYPIGCC